MSDLKVTAPRGAEDIEAIRRLCREYRSYLCGLSDFDAGIIDLLYPRDTYEALMTRLAEEHAPPRGLIRLARQSGVPVGCGMARRLAPDTAEIKRVYVTDAARGTGAGYAIMQALVDASRDMGFQRIVMDTIKPLAAAQTLYLSMGFRMRGPYQKVPPETEGHLMFFEMDL